MTRCVIRTRQHMNFDQSELDAGLSSAYKRSTCFKLQVTVHFFQNNQDDNCNISNINQGPQNIHHVLDASSRYFRMLQRQAEDMFSIDLIVEFSAFC